MSVAHIIKRLREIEAEMNRESRHDPIATHNAAGVAYAIGELQREARPSTDVRKIQRLVEDYLDIPLPLRHLRVHRVLDGDVRDDTLVECLEILNATAQACEIGRKLILGLSTLSPAQRWVLLDDGPLEEIPKLARNNVSWTGSWDTDYRRHIRQPGSWKQHPDWLVKKETNDES